MNCHLCKELVHLSEAIIVAMPLSCDITMGEGSGYLHADPFGYTGPSQTKVSLETMEGLFLVYHVDCYKELAGKRFLPHGIKVR